MSSIGLNYYNKISQFFIRKGNKMVTEKLFKDLLLTRAVQNKPSIMPLLENCFYNSMYFIKLKEKVRKRRKKVIYKITYLEKEEYEKRGLISFGKNTNSIVKNAKPFVSILTEEIESLGNMKNKTHPVRALRDSKHQLAFKRAPKR